jgi:flagellar hook-associated protein 3 FlgL
MRVTFNQMRDGLDAINTAAEQLADAQWQVATGYRVRVPSDDPDAAQRAILEQANMDRLDAYKAVADSASSRLTALDTTLGNIVDKITEALTALQSSLGSTATQPVRDAAAATFDGVRDAIVADINGTFGGTRLFAGANSDADAYARVAGNWTYQGTNAPLTVEIGPNRQVGVTMDGQSILQGSDSTDLLTLLDSLATAARSGDSATLLTGVDRLNAAFTRATRAQSQIGYDETSISDGSERLATLRIAAMTRLSESRDANMADALTRMSRAQTTYQAALGAVASAQKLSLMDYIK